MINNPICFRNKDSRKNFGDATGREFAVFFEDNKSYCIYSNGETSLVNENAEQDRIILENSVKHPASAYYLIRFKDIQWNLLDFSDKTK